MADQLPNPNQLAVWQKSLDALRATVTQEEIESMYRIIKDAALAGDVHAAGMIVEHETQLKIAVELDSLRRRMDAIQGKPDAADWWKNGESPE